MTSSLPDILARIVQHKQTELSARAGSLDALEAASEKARTTRRDLFAALRSREVAIIAEIKQASPSKGLLASETFDPPAIAQRYAAGGAAALSVLTDNRFFRGDLAHLEAARAAVNIPALRKDFTLDPVHVLEAAAAGADAILLIVAILADRQLRDLRELAERHGMAALVEVHDREELDRAIASGARIIGVNNRDLRTFEVRLETSLDLAPHIPGDCIGVSESGIDGPDAIRQLRRAGFGAFLVGEYLMRSANATATLQELLTA